MKITIICVGKLKEDFYKKAVSEYAKRLGRYCRLEIIEVADEKTPEDAGPVMEEQIKEREAARILKHVKEDALSALGVTEKQGTGAYKDFDVQVYYSRLIDLTGETL